MVNNEKIYAKGTRVKDILYFTDIAYSNFDYENIRLLINKFGIDENESFYKLSTGMQAILKAILAFNIDASYVLLDEPMLGVDAHYRKIFINELIKNYADRPRTFVIATHLINEFQNVLENILIINDTHLIYNNTIDNLLNDVYTVKGSKETIDEIEKQCRILKRKSIGSICVASVFDKRGMCGRFNVNKERLSLGEAYIALMNGE